jgi:hypothetical protein
MEFKLTGLLDALLSFLRLLGSYPPWVQIVFVCTVVMFLFSVVLGLYFYDQARGQRDRILTESRIAIDVSVMTPEPTLPPEPENPLKLMYLTGDHSALEIRPKLGYLETVTKGEPIFEILYWSCPFIWEFPNLDIKIVNNSANTIFLTEARFNVEESTPESQPLLVIKADRQQRHARHFELRNEGWADVVRCSATYGLVPWRESWKQIDDAMRAEAEFHSARHEVSIGPFSNNISVDVSAGLIADGVDLSALDKLLSQSDEGITEDEWNRMASKALGPFKEASALVYGTLVYSWESAAKGIVDKRLPFFTRVFIANQNLEGLPRPPSAQYNALLELHKKDYSVSVQLSQEIKPNEVDRFNIRLGAAQTSLHRFTLQLIYNDGRALAPLPVSIHIFVPRSGVKKQAETTRDRQQGA